MEVSLRLSWFGLARWVAGSPDEIFELDASFLSSGFEMSLSTVSKSDKNKKIQDILLSVS